MPINQVFFRNAVRSVLCIVLIILLQGYVFSAEFIVSSAAQISTVMTNQASPGDTLTMTSGTWTNQLIVFKGNGTAGHPILLRAQGGYGSVILTGTSTLRIGGNYLIVDGLKFENGRSSSGDVIEFRSSSSLESHYSRLTNSAVINYNPTSSATDYKWISIYGTHNRVDHCYTEGKTHSGTTLVVWRPTTAGNYHQIDHNYFGPRPELGVNGGETIRLGTSDQSLSSSYTVVEFNYFRECNGETEIISNKSCDNIYRYNTFVDCEGTLTLRHGNRCRVEGNFFFGNRKSNTGGIRIIGEDHVVINNYVSGTMGSGFRSALSFVDGIVNSPLNGYYQVKRAIVAFNTFVNNDYNITLGAGKDSDNVLPPLDCIIANNIVYGTHSPLVIVTDTPINLTWQKNIFYGTSVGLTPLPAGITVTDPKLEPKGSDGLQHLMSTSPAINSSEGEYSSALFDMDGQSRDAQKDVGADEYSVAPSTIHPLTAIDAGPDAVSYTITVTQNEHGVIVPGTTSIRSGESQRFIVTPSPGYFLDSLVVDNININDSTTSYTFVNVLGNHTIYARFSVPTFTLIINAEHGEVTKIPDLSEYDSATVVTLTALPSWGYHFNGWSGDLTGVENPAEVSMDGNKIISALFAVNEYPLNISITGNGTVIKIPDKAEYTHGETVQLIAIPQSGSTFSGWAGSTLSFADTLFLQMDTVKNIIADFRVSSIKDSIEVNQGWNLLSIPVDMSDTRVDSLFPSGMTSSFIFQNGYVAKDTITTGAGFWMKFPAVDTIEVEGLPLMCDTIVLLPGWNLVGSLSELMRSDSMRTEPPTILLSQFFSYSTTGYSTADTILPGKGYWVKANEPGYLILNVTGYEVNDIREMNFLRKFSPRSSGNNVYKQNEE